MVIVVGIVYIDRCSGLMDRLFCLRKFLISRIDWIVMKMFLLKNMVMLLVFDVCVWICWCIDLGSLLCWLIVVVLVIGVISGCIICVWLLSDVRLSVVVVWCSMKYSISMWFVVVVCICEIICFVCFLSLLCLSSVIIGSVS